MFLTRTRRGRRLFTLIELIVVLVVLGVLAALAIPTFTAVKAGAAERVLTTSAQSVVRDANAILALDVESPDPEAALDTAVSEVTDPAFHWNTTLNELSSTNTGVTRTVKFMLTGGSWTVGEPTVNGTVASDAPSGLAATPGVTQVSLTWTAPGFTGGAPVTDYTVMVSSDAGVSWAPFTDSVSPTTTAMVTGLANGASYQFKVAAVNAAGTSGFSSTVTSSPYSVPAAPTGLTAVKGISQVALSWTAPADGGSPITDYLVEVSNDAGVSWVPFTHAASTTPSLMVTALTNGQVYQFQVSALNAAGTGAASTSASATPEDYPGDPNGFHATITTASSVTLAWDEVPSTLAQPVTGYHLYRWSGVMWEQVFTGPGLTFLHTGLTAGLSYDYRVTAYGTGGEGPNSSPVTVTPNLAPAAPTGLTATPSDTQVGLSWTAPVTNGGTTLTDYYLEYKVGAGAWGELTDPVSTVTTMTVTGLVNGTSYQFRVSGVNAAGTGVVSDPFTVVPVTVPSVPSGFSSVPGDGQVTLSWTAPASDGGSPVTDYMIEYLADVGVWPGTNVAHTASNATTRTVTGLNNGISYIFRVKAVNAVGSSVWANDAGAGIAELSGVTPYTVPGAPSVPTVTPGEGSLTVTWPMNFATNGSGILDYTVTSSPSGLTCTTAGLTCTFTTMASNTAYAFSVTSHNAAGSSAASTASAAVYAFNVAAGGTVATITNYNGTGQTWRVHRFDGNGTLTVTKSAGPFRILVVAAGGGGGSNGGTGGGGGRVVSGTPAFTLGTYSIVVGAGPGGNQVGGDSSIPSPISVTAVGGGSGSYDDGVTGMIGGTTKPGGTATANGGEGAGGPASGWNGGPGISSNITGSTVLYGGGGGRGSNADNGSGGGAGTDGGGNGSPFAVGGGSGATNRGGGGGGGGRYGAGGGAGGSGVVIVAYRIS